MESSVPEQKPVLPLYGVDRYKVDAKNRVALPAKHRKVLPKDLVVMLSPDREYPSLVISSEKGFDDYRNAMFEKDGGFKQSSLEHRRKQHNIDKNATFVEMDSAGRIKIPQEQLDKARIGKDVVILGDKDSVSVWDIEVWAAYEEFLDSMDMLDS
jgi:MraZ protein